MPSRKRAQAAKRKGPASGDAACGKKAKKGRVLLWFLIHLEDYLIVVGV